MMWTVATVKLCRALKLGYKTKEFDGWLIIIQTDMIFSFSFNTEDGVLYSPEAFLPTYPNAQFIYLEGHNINLHYNENLMYCAVKFTFRSSARLPPLQHLLELLSVRDQTRL
jgi:hypothetical protein